MCGVGLCVRALICVKDLHRVSVIVVVEKIVALEVILVVAVVAVALQSSSFLLQNSSFLIHNSSFLIQNSSFLLTGSIVSKPVLTDKRKQSLTQSLTQSPKEIPGRQAAVGLVCVVADAEPGPSHCSRSSACKIHHF